MAIFRRLERDIEPRGHTRVLQGEQEGRVSEGTQAWVHRHDVSVNWARFARFVYAPIMAQPLILCAG